MRKSYHIGSLRCQRPPQYDEPGSLKKGLAKSRSCSVHRQSTGLFGSLGHRPRTLAAKPAESAAAEIYLGSNGRRLHGVIVMWIDSQS